MAAILKRARALFDRMRLARYRRKQLLRDQEARRFEERQDLHQAGIYEPPPATGL